MLSDDSYKLDIRTIVLGQPIPWNIYNSEGVLLFRKGFIFNNAQSLERVAALDLYHGASNSVSLQADSCVNCHTPLVQNKHCCEVLEDHSRQAKVITIRRDKQGGQTQAAASDGFRLIEQMLLELKSWTENIHSGSKTTWNTLVDISNTLRMLFLQDTDLCIASMYLLDKYPNVNAQPICAAFLCLLGAEIVGIKNEKDYISLICAALTANLSLYRDYDRINQHSGNLSQELKLILQAHPQKSARILKSLGVRDELWLSMVEHHHYAQSHTLAKKIINDLQLEKILNLYNISDTLLSLISKRGYRNKVTFDEALNYIINIVKGQKAEILQQYRNLIGPYPPGSLVKLSNNETALVWRRNLNSILQPTVKTVLDSNNLPVIPGAVVCIEDSPLSITGSVGQDHLKHRTIDDIYLSNTGF